MADGERRGARAGEDRAVTDGQRVIRAGLAQAEIAAVGPFRSLAGDGDRHAARKRGAADSAVAIRQISVRRKRQGPAVDDDVAANGRRTAAGQREQTCTGFGDGEISRSTFLENSRVGIGDGVVDRQRFGGRAAVFDDRSADAGVAVQADDGHVKVVELHFAGGGRSEGNAGICSGAESRRSARLENSGIDRGAARIGIRGRQSQCSGTAFGEARSARQHRTDVGILACGQRVDGDHRSARQSQDVGRIAVVVEDPTACRAGVGVAKAQVADGANGVETHRAVGGDVDGAKICGVAGAVGNDRAGPGWIGGDVPNAVAVEVPGSGRGLGRVVDECCAKQREGAIADNAVFFIFHGNAMVFDEPIHSGSNGN